jgi:uncharacterized protein YndB with AHSA1/START domain
LKFAKFLPLTDRPEEVWRRVSDVERIPAYWHGTSSIRVTERKGSGLLNVSVEFAFGGRGEAEVSVDNHSRTLTLSYYSGPFTGMQRVTVGSERISASWDISFTGLFKLLSPWNVRHFRAGTIHALERLNSGSAS